jgi:hypothetical protein
MFFVDANSHPPQSPFVPKGEDKLAGAPRMTAN